MFMQPNEAEIQPETKPQSRNRVVRRHLQAVVALLCLAIIVYAKITGPDPGYTGAPGDIGSCVLCHDTFHEANMGPGSVRVDNVPAVYTPGQRYTLNVTTQQSGRSRFGFQLTALDLTGHRAGTLAPLDANTQLTADTGLGGRQYIEHTQQGTAAIVAGSRTWQIGWTAPDTDIGPVVFWFAGNAANNDETNQGDYIYTSLRSSDSPTSVVTLSLNSDPGGSTLEGGSSFKIDWSVSGASNIDNVELRYSTDDGATFPISSQIFFTTDPSVTSFEWTVPNKPTDEARIRIRVGKKSGDAIEVLSGRFTIAAGSDLPPPVITGASRSGKKLFVSGENFQDGAKVEMDGVPQKTANDEDSSHLLRCKKAGKKISPGQTVTLIVRNPDGTASNSFLYTRPDE
ncbi:MAG TPA: choice-of-anchor V domain-containing protein [Blastocatellia bacterium]|nr:choice-of-anchor V domain-containing protein [Blastocatellia bacterium]